MFDYAGSAYFCSAGAAGLACAGAAAAFAEGLDIFVFGIFPRYDLKL